MMITLSDVCLSVLVLLCRLRSIVENRDHFVRRLSFRLSVCLSVRPSVCLSGSHTFLVVTHSYVSKATRAFLWMLPLCFFFINNDYDSYDTINISSIYMHYVDDKKNEQRLAVLIISHSKLATPYLLAIRTRHTYSCFSNAPSAL